MNLHKTIIIKTNKNNYHREHIV